MRFISALMAIAMATLGSACTETEWPHRDAGHRDASIASDSSTDARGEALDAGDAAEEEDAAAEKDATSEQDAALDAAEADAALDASTDSAAEPDAILAADASLDTLEDSSIESDASQGADAARDAAQDATVEPDAAASACGGPDDIPCATNEFCDFGSECFANPKPLGVCAPRPSQIECEGAPWKLVCGCDGTTYWNACAAHAKGVSVQYDRYCDSGTPICGESEFSSSPRIYCEDSNQLCVWGDNCFPGMVVYGRCVDRPSSCPDVDDPVCTCGRTTYRNACVALLDGYVSRPGACVADPNPRPCHDPFYIGVDLGCLQGQYCNTSTRCRGTGSSRPGEGMCQDIPSTCPAESAPVCGCNGVTYVNECEAHRAAASVASQGPC
jgi:hypothetical protein